MSEQQKAQHLLTQWSELYWQLSPAPDRSACRCSRAVRPMVVLKFAALTNDIGRMAIANNIDSTPLFTLARDIDGASPEAWGAAQATAVRLAMAIDGNAPTGSMICENAEQAISKIGREWATYEELARVTGRQSAAAVRARITEFEKTHPGLGGSCRRSVPDSRKCEFKIKAVWGYVCIRAHARALK